MTGPSSWPQSPQAVQPPPVGHPPVGHPPVVGAQPVAWAGGVAAPEAPRPARPPADVGGVLRLVAAVLLLAAGALAAVAPFLRLYALDYEGDETFAVGAWGVVTGEDADTPLRWGIPMLVAAAALVVGAVLVLVSRWVRGLRPVGSAVALLGVGGVLAVGWVLGAFVGDYTDVFADETLVGTGYDTHTGVGTVLLVVALWTALAAVVPLLLAPVLDAVRARATAGGAR